MSGNLRSILGQGIYSVPEAARLTHVHPRTIRRWLRGYTYQVQDGSRKSPEVVLADLPEIDGALALSFRDLIEVRFVNAFRQYGVSWKVLRATSLKARKIFGTSHPFSTKAFKTDGKTIFTEIAAELGGSEDPKLLDILRDQYVIRNILVPHLYKGLETRNGQIIRWWHDRKRVVLDPERSFGQPVVHKDGIPTAVLAKAVKIEGSLERVASWFEVHAVSVQAAVDFEERLAA